MRDMRSLTRWGIGNDGSMYGGTAAALPVFAEVVDTMPAIAVATTSATTTERLILPPPPGDLPSAGVVLLEWSGSVFGLSGSGKREPRRAIARRASRVTRLVAVVQHDVVAVRVG